MEVKVLVLENEKRKSEVQFDYKDERSTNLELGDAERT